MTEEIKTAWIISETLNPVEVEIIKTAKKQSTVITTDSFHDRKTVSNDDIYGTKKDCLFWCLRENYKHLEFYAKCCGDMMEKIKRQEAQLDAERSK